MYDDMEVICYRGYHKIIVFAVALPALILYGLGIPTLGLFLVYQNREKLNTIHIKQKYGFLFNGYRPGQAQYWEFVIMYRKIIIIFIQIILAQRGKIVQVRFTGI